MEILSSYLQCLREEAAEQSAELSVIRDAIAPMAWLSLQIDTTNLCGAPNEQYSHGWDSLIGVLFCCILHFVLYCTIDLSRTSNKLKMYLVISRGIK